MKKTSSSSTRALVAVVCALAVNSVVSAHDHKHDHDHDHKKEAAAHVHGQATLQISVENDVLEIAFETPLDSLLGFERTPRTEREKQAAAAVLNTFRNDQTLFVFPSAAGCKRTKVDIDADRLEPGKKDAEKDDHADLKAEYSLRCSDISKLNQIETSLFAKYPRLSRITVEVAAPNGQYRVDLKRPDKVIQLR